MDLQPWEKTPPVTGCRTVIGFAIAERLATQGVQVVVNAGTLSHAEAPAGLTQRIPS